MSAVLEVRDLTLTLGDQPILRRVSFSAEAGRITALVGESGSGKSLTLLAAMGLAPKHARISGQVFLDGEDLLKTGEKRLTQLRGARIGMVFQEVMSALNPVRSIGDQIAEVVRVHGKVSVSVARAAARAVLDRVGLDKIDASQYPHQLSGGQRQRVAIAIAIILKPSVLLADEPTTALDVTTQAQILDLLRSLVREDKMALVLVTHDLALVSRYADDVALMKQGELVERSSGDLRQLTHPYAHALLEAAIAVPRRSERGDLGEALLEFRNVGFGYSRRRNELNVDGVSFALHAGETLGLVGESGSGKSTIARLALGLVRPRAGEVLIGGQSFRGVGRTLEKRMRRQTQIVFQDPYGSFNPRQRIECIVAEPLHLSEKKFSKLERRARVEAVLEQVGLKPKDADRYPHEFSGGQRQRIALARALIVEPRLIVLDEALSALDVSVRAQILALLADIGERTGVSFLFISHDLHIVQGIADRVLVLKNGRIIEEGKTEEVFSSPRHDYTRALIDATPRLALSD